MSKTGLLLALLLASCAAGPVAPPIATGFVDKVVAVDGVEHRYVVYVPDGYRGERAWPLILFLNGLGECGTDGRKQAEVGLGAAIRDDPGRWPFVVVFPQKPERGTQWADHEDLALAALAAAEHDYRVDAGRRFLTGLSQGGCGAWTLGARHPELWAAVAPVCGYDAGGFDVTALRETPVWAFHGDADRAVPVAQSQRLCEALREAGGAPRLTTYEGVGHNSWDRAYGESELPSWLLEVAAARGRAQPSPRSRMP